MKHKMEWPGAIRWIEQQEFAGGLRSTGAVSFDPDEPGKTVMSGLGSGGQVALSADLDQHTHVLRRDVDGGGAHSEAGSVLRLERDVTGTTSESGFFIHAYDGPSGQTKFAVDKNGEVRATAIADNMGGNVFISLGGSDFQVVSPMGGHASSSLGTPAMPFPGLFVDEGSADGTTVVMANLPGSDPANAGQLWNDGGTVKVSAG